ncbi:MAG: glycerol-3-phosphate 1-O-acyltransferase PlsY [Gammaproteobacteria bacterium]|nr:glycerol-3-phosphate 1-O-acyltransferase PlsY [Gammaproteobacteria bacterium]
MLETLHITDWLPVLAVAVAAYLFGSISTAIVTCRIMGLPDPRSLGSGNPGATNVLRTGSKKAAIITLLGDSIKGLLPVLMALIILPEHPRWCYVLVGLAAFLGHVYPVYYGFKGGKGVATAFGVLLGYCWPVFLAALATWLLMAGIFRYSALAALTAFALAPVYAFLFGSQIIATLLIALLSAMIFWRHQANIKRLLQGQESRIGAKAKV